MKHAATAIFLFLGACGAFAADDDAAFKKELAKAEAGMRAELGAGFIVEQAGIFVVAGDFARRDFAWFKKHTIENCADALWGGFFDEKPDHPIKIYLFRDKASYEKWVKKLAGFKPKTPYGFYLRDTRSMMMNIGTGGGTLVHEMTHALTDADFPDCPTWLFEGLGSLFEQCRITRGGHIEGLVNWRLPVLRKGGFVPLEDLVKMSNAEFRGDNEPRNYANARYLCLYLQERGLLTKFYKAFRKAHKADEDKTGWETFKKMIESVPDSPAGFEKEWHVWVETLEWPERRKVR